MFRLSPGLEAVVRSASEPVGIVVALFLVALLTALELLVVGDQAPRARRWLSAASVPLLLVLAAAAFLRVALLTS